MITMLALLLATTCMHGMEETSADSHNSTYTLYKTLVGHTAAVKSLIHIPTPNIVCSGSNDTTIRVWDFKTGNCIKTIEAGAGTIWSLAYNPDTQQFYSGSGDCMVKVWDLRTYQCLEEMMGSVAAVVRVQKSDEKDHLLATSTGGGTIRNWNLKTKEYVKAGLCTFWSSDVYKKTGDWCASTGSNSSPFIYVYDKKNNPITFLSGHTAAVNSVTYRQTDGTICSGSSDDTVKIWQNNTCTETLIGPTNAVNAVTYQEDTGYIFSGSSDTTVKVWQPLP